MSKKTYHSFEELNKAFGEFDNSTMIVNDSNTGEEKTVKFVQRAEVVAIVGYMLGVEDKILDEYYSYYHSSTLKKVRCHQNANIIRNLSRVRTALMKNFLNVDSEIVYQMTNLDRMSYFDKDEIKNLQKWGVPLIQSNFRAEKYCEYICELMGRYIDRCQELFPKYIKFEYIKNCFIVANYKKAGVLKEEYKKYKGNINLYPHQLYIYWMPKEIGNLLYSDEKFLKEIYRQNGDVFTEKGMLHDATDDTKEGIYDFIRRSKKVVLAVDCENSNPYKIYGVLKNLKEEEVKLIDKIYLYDDMHTTPGWDYLGKLIDIPVEHIEIERVTDSKSLVDIKLTAGVCEAFYSKGVDSFILCSSDSDFWGLISSLPTANFLMLYEYAKCGNAIRDMLTSQNIFHCALDDFFQLESNELKEIVLCKALERHACDLIGENSWEFTNMLYAESFIDASNSEKKAFYEKIIKNISLELDSEKKFIIQINSK